LAKCDMSLLCLVDSSRNPEFESLHETLWSALDFYGMAYEVVDLAESRLSPEVLRSHSAIVIGQEHLGESLLEHGTEAVVDAVNEGVGLVCFDGDLHQYKQPLKDAFGLKTTEEPTHMPHLNTAAVRIWENKHFITAAKELELVRFDKPVEVGNVVNIEKDHSLLMVAANSSGTPALVAETYGRGKAVLFALSMKVWLREYFGHGGGLDDIFWRSIVWAARKPFAILAMLPFVTIRIDDCSGTNDFEWVRILNKHGFIPHVSLFTENIGKRAVNIIKELYDAGLAEFSVHAFTWTDQVYWKPKSPVNHSEGNEYSQEEFTRFFKKLDRLAKEWGIEWSKVLTAHFGEVGRTAIPFLKERGITYLGMPYAFGVPYGVSSLGLPESGLRGLKPFNGRGGVIDHYPDDPELFIVSPSYTDVPNSMLQMLIAKGAVTPKGQIYDFLWETAREKVDVELGAWYAAFGIKFCLNNLACAVLVTHEQNISILNNEEWDSLLRHVDELTARYERIYRSWSQTAEYAKNLYNSRLTHATYDNATKEVECRLEGKSDVTLYLHLFKDGFERVERGFKEVPSYEGKVAIKFKPEHLLFRNF